MDKRKYFGTDGVRGKVGGPVVNPACLLKLGFALGTVLKQQTQSQPMVLIGRDTRMSGEALQSALISGLLSAGVNVCVLGVMPTPAIAYFIREMHATAGLVISASHNPFDDNGVKCLDANGMKLPDEWELSVEEKMLADIHVESHTEFGTIQICDEASERYIHHCQTLFQSALPLSPLKIVLDCANGATSFIAPRLFRALGASVIAIHAEPNGMNINEQCGATHLASLQAHVAQEKADCGLAFDGDGDRLMMVDQQGRVVDGDEILGILALHQRDMAGVVGTLMSNLGLEKALTDQGIAFKRAAVGDRYVLASMMEKGWRLGGESSGHIVNLDYSSTGDGILTGLQVLQVMLNTQLPLHELRKAIRKRPQVLINVLVQNPKQFSEMTEIQNAVAKTEAMLDRHGRVLLRASGTESCVRVMVECDHESQAQQLAQSLAEVVKRCFSRYGASHVGVAKLV